MSNLISGSQAKQYIKDRVDEWLSLYGTVKKSYGDIVIKYEDYNFSTSDSAMADIAKHISRFVNKPIVVSCCQKSWVFDKTEYYEGGYSIHGNQITPKVSSKKLYEIKDAIAYYGVEVLDSITSRTTDSYGVSAKTEKVPQNRW